MIENQRRAIIGFTLTGEKSLQAAADKFLSQPGLRVRETFTQQPGDLTAIGAVANAQSQNGEIVTLLAYLIQHRDRVYRFIAYSAPQSFEYFKERILASGAWIREPERPGSLEYAAGTAGTRARAAHRGLPQLDSSEAAERIYTGRRGDPEPDSAD